MKRIKWLAIGSSVLVGVVLLGGVTFAQTMPPRGGFLNYSSGNHAPGVFGKVSAVSGTTITLTSGGFGRGSGQDATTTTYTVDASSATVVKNGTSSALDAVDVGDTIFVQGTVSGTNVTATSIRDGMPPGGMPTGSGGMRGFRNASGTWNESSTPRRPAPGSMPQNIIQGNGEPVVGGSVTAISGDMLTVTPASGTIAYAVDATNATIEKDGATSTIGSIVVGDDILVQGSVSGTSVAASSVIDQGAPHTASSSKANVVGGGRGFGGFMDAIGGFFHHMFGFF